MAKVQRNARCCIAEEQRREEEEDGEEEPATIVVKGASPPTLTETNLDVSHKNSDSAVI